MKTLEDLVPAFRQARTPLVSGYLWLLFAWLSLAQYRQIDDSQLFKSNQGSILTYTLDALHIFSGFGLGAVVSVVAYLIGSMLVALGHRVFAHSDPRAVPEEISTQLAEAEFRIHVAIPTLLTAATVSAPDSIRYPIAIFGAAIFTHGLQIRSSTRRKPLGHNKCDLDLTHAKMSHSDLKYTDFSRSTLQGANLSKSSCRGCTFTGSNLQDADLSNADLTGASFRNADLRGASFREANLRNVDFTGAKLLDINLAGTNLTRTTGIYGKDLPSARSVWRTYLTRQDFSGLDMSYIIFGGTLELPADDYARGSNTWSSLHSWSPLHPNMRRMIIRIRKRLSPNRYMFIDPYDMLPGANLSGSKFVGTNLSHARLAGVHLIDADFTGANLTDADLTGSDISGAIFTDANLDNIVVRYVRWCKTNPPTWPKDFEPFPIVKTIPKDPVRRRETFYSVEYDQPSRRY